MHEASVNAKSWEKVYCMQSYSTSQETVSELEPVTSRSHGSNSPWQDYLAKTLALWLIEENPSFIIHLHFLQRKPSLVTHLFHSQRRKPVSGGEQEYCSWNSCCQSADEIKIFTVVKWWSFLKHFSAKAYKNQLASDGYDQTLEKIGSGLKVCRFYLMHLSMFKDRHDSELS